MRDPKSNATLQKGTKKLMAESPWMRKEFPSKLLQEAISKENVEEATRIKEILCNESQNESSAKPAPHAQLG